MIVLDTNVISELMSLKPEKRVLKWADSHDPSELYTTAVTAAELHSGLESMPKGRQRDGLGERIGVMIGQGMRGRILPFDVDCALHFGRIFIHRRSIGQRIEVPDAMIAAICASHDFKIATRNMSDFEYVGLDIVNPWTD